LFVKNRLVRLLRSRRLQPIWERLHHVSIVGMNYWGGASIQTSGELAALRYVRECLEPDAAVIFDIGANIGEYTLQAAREFGEHARIFSFEPSSTAFQKLLAATALMSTVRVFNHGFGDVSESRDLYSPHNGSVKGSLYGNGRGLVVESVSLRTIDEFCEEERIEKIHLLKIDVEGHEHRVLRGAKTMIDGGQVQFIQFEFGECHLESRSFYRDFHELLAPRYKLYRIVPDGLSPIQDKYSIELEVFATINYFAELRM